LINLDIDFKMLFIVFIILYYYTYIETLIEIIDKNKFSKMKFDNK